MCSTHVPANPVKLLHLVPAYFPEGAGGIQNYVRRLVREQRAAGHEVAVLAGQPDGRPQVGLERGEFEGAPVWRLYRNDPYLEHFSRGVHPVARELILDLAIAEGYELLHVHSWIRLSGDLIAAAAERGLPSVATLHDYLVSCVRCYRHHADGAACTRPFSLENCVPCAPRLGSEDDATVGLGVQLFAETLETELNAAQRIFVSTAGMRDRLADWVGWDPGRCSVLPLPSEVELQPAAQVAPGPPWRLATWGRHSWHKGTGLLLKALRLMGDAAQHFQLQVYGPLEPVEFDTELQALAEGLPVEFCGPFRGPDLSEVQAHLAVFTTACLETHGLVLDEARALGWPVLVPDVGALADRLGHPQACYTHDCAQALADCLLRWHADPAWRAGLVPPTVQSDPWAEHLARLMGACSAALEPAPDLGSKAQRGRFAGDRRWRKLRDLVDGESPY